MANSDTKILPLVGGLVVLITTVAMAMPSKAVPMVLRRLSVSNKDWVNDVLTFRMQFKGLANEPDLDKLFTIPFRKGFQFRDFKTHRILITGDDNTRMLSVDLYDNAIATPIQRIVINFIRREVREQNFTNDQATV